MNLMAMSEIGGGPPPVPSGVNPHLPPEIDAWFTKAFARKPDERFATPRALAESFTRLRIGRAMRSLRRSVRIDVGSAPVDMRMGNHRLFAIVREQ
jgi:hypothetical protein